MNVIAGDCVRNQTERRESREWNREMGIFSAKSKGSITEGGGWGLGLLLVLFPEDERKKRVYAAQNTGSNQLFNRAQSTIAICGLILLFTLVLFIWCTFDSTSTPAAAATSRFLYVDRKKKTTLFALQGMGTLYLRGSRGMSHLVVAHFNQTTKPQHVRMFLRHLHRSGLTTTSDVAFIFPCSSTCTTSYSDVIHQENQSFLRLIRLDGKQQFTNRQKRVVGPLWGRGPPTHHSSSSSNHSSSTNETLLVNWGSVVGFQAGELDPEDSLSGFLGNHVPMRLRRWACYAMLVGRVRRHFNNVILMDLNHHLIPLLTNPTTTTTMESLVYLWKMDTNSHQQGGAGSVSMMTADVIMGGTPGIRRLSQAMLNQIVIAATQHNHNHNHVSLSDSLLLTNLIHNDFLLRNINIHITIPQSPSTV